MAHPYYQPPTPSGSIVPAVKTEQDAKMARDVERGPLRSIRDGGESFPTISIAVSPTTLPENDASGEFDFTITLSAPAPNAITITPTWSGTATNVTDYTREAGATWTINEGATQFVVDCDLAASPGVSVNETVILTIAAVDANGYPLSVTEGGALSATFTVTPV